MQTAFGRFIYWGIKMKLTAKQEAFCLAYLETGNASEAYRRAYNTKRMKPATVNRKAKELLDHGKIAARLAQLQGEAAKRNEITVDSLISELEEARQLALQEGQPSAMVSATMGKAKITGYDKQIIDHRSSDGSMSPQDAGAAVLAALRAKHDAGGSE